MKFSELSQDALAEQISSLSDQYEKYRSAGLNLDLTRGKPSSEQLDLANGLDGILDGFYILQDGTDVRNYGGLFGIPEARELGGEILNLDPKQIMVGGNSSLTLMYHYVSFMVDNFWRQQSIDAGTKIKFLCPVPGYDRHFTICEHFDIEMINVEMTSSGPDMDFIEKTVDADPMIKGIWCVPKYSNPTGVTFDDETVKRMSKLPSLAGPDFKIIWDNAYAVHHLSTKPDVLLDLMNEAQQQATTGAVIMVASTSKITFAGAGISFIGMTEDHLNEFADFMTAQTIGADKVNQLRHVRFLVNAEGVDKHMDKHRAILSTKFEETETILQTNLGGKGIASWTHPNGGYFVSLDTMPGLASEVVRMAGKIGVKLTPAGAPFPYGNDPHDRNIRIAPTYPTLNQLRQALEVLVVCLQLATSQHLFDANA